MCRAMMPVQVVLTFVNIIDFFKSMSNLQHILIWNGAHAESSLPPVTLCN